MQLLERDGNICRGVVKGKKCTHSFTAIDDIRVNHIDGNSDNNPEDLSNYNLVCNAANFDQWLEQERRLIVNDNQGAAEGKNYLSKK